MYVVESDLVGDGVLVIGGGQGQSQLQSQSHLQQQLFKLTLNPHA